VNKRSSFLQYAKEFNANKNINLEFAIDENLAEHLISDAMESIKKMISNWCEYTDLKSANSKKPTKFLQIFDLLFNDNRNLTYKEISEEVGGANVEKIVYNFNAVAIAKILKMRKENAVYITLLDGYYKWIGTLISK